MRLITHNLLMCNTEKCVNGYPLKISPSIVDDACKTISQELNPQFIRKMLQRMDYPSLVDAAKSVGLDLPASYSESDLENDSFLAQVHHCILEFHVLEATLTCPQCGRVYTISKGMHESHVHMRLQASLTCYTANPKTRISISLASVTCRYPNLLNRIDYSLQCLRVPVC
ncbi:hypothetical protein X943_003970 [Babesia divergens]|uniref:C2H2-type domain-containing protein n=1 Tax=Babesia divergens TaxID=32595 RepID=A0AAD9G843_BABDI|nr:hypothetical protein X943_003970 [Babesia divergens]